MKKLFGTSKKQEPQVPTAPAPTLTETSEKLGTRGGVIQGKVDECNKQLMEVKNQMKTAKGASYKSLQQKALGILRRRKMYDAQLNNIQNQQFNVDQVQFASESIQDTINVAATLKEATAVQQQQMKQLDLDKLEDIFEDLKDLMEDQEEIQEVMARSYQVDYDESELLDELGELDEEIVSEQLDGTVSVPSYVPSSQPAAATGQADADQLKGMMQI